ncbi:MAG: SRPBCC family protein [Actinomycetota bacterium]|nr:SRPBCC family protein [Actinomycetota bacterium]
MDVVADLTAPCTAEELFRWVDDLGRYPQWLGIVERAEALPDQVDGRPAWQVELRGRLGPLARSKRLRMVRTVLSDDAVVFERNEHDGRNHSTWVLRADVAPTSDGSVLTMRLHYGGSLWGPVLERLLRDEIERSRTRLLDRVAGR